MSRRVVEKTGTRGAMDSLRIAEGPKDVARAARLAEAQGGKTRAILKLLGRGALLLRRGVQSCALAVRRGLTLFGLLSSIKATTERLTQAWCDRRRARRASPGADRRRQPFWRRRCRHGLGYRPFLPSRFAELMMPSFHNGAVEIAYLDEGEGDPIILVHGFASSKNVNWVYPTWVSELRKDGRRVIALDNRGHGEMRKALRSRAVRDPDHGWRRLALMDHLAIAQRRHHGLFAGRADDGGLALDAAAAAALGNPRRHRHAA